MALEPLARNPGDVVVGSLGLTKKPRPWLVLWVNDGDGVCCVVGLTTQADHPGAIPTGHPQYRHAAGFATVLPVEATGRPGTYGYFNEAQRDAVRDALKRKLDL